MKKYTLIFLIFVMSCTGSQYYLFDIRIDEVKQYENKTKNELFNRSLKWVALNTNWSKSVIDYQDSSIATIIVKANVNAYDYLERYSIPCVFEINIKDNKMNVIITNGYESQTFVKPDKNAFKSRLNDLAKELLDYSGNKDDF